mgnify:CR=1 FL=1
MNIFGEKSLLALRPLLLKRLPNHLEELKLIDCHINSSHVCRLLDLLLETNCQLHRLALVHASHNENSIDKIIQFMQTCGHLQELDLSWSKLSLLQWRNFMLAVKDNRQLVSLNLSFNKLLEDQPLPTGDVNSN